MTFHDPKPIRRTWRGVTYDSQLEADWAATLTVRGMEYVYHPGRMYLSNGDIWEPDFQLEDDYVLEVKGAHDERIDKAWRAASETSLNVIVGRAGWIPPRNDVEACGAVWEPTDYVVVNRDSRLRFTRAVESGASYSADVAYEHELDGIRWFKAVGDDDIK